MEEFKSIAISICAVTLMFGIIKNILPSGRYEKNMRLILILIFVILTVNGIRSVINDQGFNVETINVETKNIAIEDQLSQQITRYLNDLLKERSYEAECLNVTVSGEGENYYISKILISTDSDEVIAFLKEITGLQGEQIYVNT